MMKVRDYWISNVGIRRIEIELYVFNNFVLEIILQACANRNEAIVVPPLY